MVKVPGVYAEGSGVSAGNVCPQCGATTRPDAAWCSLCFAQLAGGFDPLTAPIDEVLGHSDGATKTATPPVVHEDIETYVDEVPRQVVDPITTADLAAGSPVPMRDPLQDPLQVPVRDLVPPAAPTPEVDEEVTEVDVMLAMLAAEHREQDPTAKVLDRMGDKSSRVLIIISGTAAVGAAVFICLTILGALT